MRRISHSICVRQSGTQAKGGGGDIIISRTRDWTLSVDTWAHAVDAARAAETRQRFTREQCQLIKKYLPSVPIFELSTSLHAAIAGRHWNEVYREGSLSGTSKRSRHSWGRDGNHREQHTTTTTSIRQLYNTFYVYLEEHAPDLMPFFRASMHVRSKVLVHISTGMRSIWYVRCSTR